MNASLRQPFQNRPNLSFQQLSVPRGVLMSKRRAGSIKSSLLVTCAATVILASACPAWGALGGDVSSVQADQVHMQGSRETVAAQSYTVHEIRAATGVVVREYVSSAGIVFAVAWHGPWLPDMRQLLGSYFEQYVQAAKAQSGARMGRRPLMIEQPGLVVESGGHLRAFSGKAYVPDMLPSGVRAEDIQ
jgi:Protein of unknown function (DUF2844)